MALWALLEKSVYLKSKYVLDFDLDSLF